MLHSIFLWFYCLPIADAALFTILLSIAYCILRRWLGEKRFWRPTLVLFLLAWLGVIAIATLADRAPNSVPLEPQLIPFHSYRAVLAGANRELLRSNFMNTILFYPAGLLACESMPSRWCRVKRVCLSALLLALVSVGIELFQYLYALGQAEVDDVLHNGLGALLGALVSAIRIKSEK